MKSAPEHWQVWIDEGEAQPMSVYVELTEAGILEWAWEGGVIDIVFVSPIERHIESDIPRLARTWWELHERDNGPVPEIFQKHLESQIYERTQLNESGPYSADDYADYRRDAEYDR